MFAGRRGRSKARAGIGLLIVDYLQLMVGSGGTETGNIRHLWRTQGVGEELRIPVIALSQLNRKPRQRPNKRPVMSDLRESGLSARCRSNIVLLPGRGL